MRLTGRSDPSTDCIFFLNNNRDCILQQNVLTESSQSFLYVHVWYALHLFVVLCCGWGRDKVGGGWGWGDFAYDRCREDFQPENHTCLQRKLLLNSILLHVATFDGAFPRATKFISTFGRAFPRTVDQAF